MAAFPESPGGVIFRGDDVARPFFVLAGGVSWSREQNLSRDEDFLSASESRKVLWGILRAGDTSSCAGTAGLLRYS